MLQPVIGEHIELRTRLNPGMGKVVADAGQMEQVIMNLILNARDAMPRGGSITIEVSTCEMNEGTAQAYGMKPGKVELVSVSDTGHGMEPAVLEHIWEPFFTTKEKGKGTGLGLNTVQRVIRESGGDIWAETAPGLGTTFTICLPRAAPGSDGVDFQPLAEPVPAGNETVLVVEDEDSVRLLLTQILRRRGYQVLEASSGAEALSIFERQAGEIHMVLTDMVMPAMTGRELANRLAQIQPDVKVIFMSGYTDDVLVRTGALGPGMSFLQKPLRSEALAAKVREALDSPARPFNPC
jgi:CheY-like chemotaxis protein